jgi:hypothetical protein
MIKVLIVVLFYGQWLLCCFQLATIDSHLLFWSIFQI